MRMRKQLSHGSIDGAQERRDTLIRQYFDLGYKY